MWRFPDPLAHSSWLGEPVPWCRGAAVQVPGTRAPTEKKRRAIAELGMGTNSKSLGSYSCYKPGQWTSLGGEEGKPVDDLHFAGEQCSSEYQGYMNDGAETGRTAAEAVIAK